MLPENQTHCQKDHPRASSKGPSVVLRIVPEAPQANPVVVSGKDNPDSLFATPEVSVDHFSALAILRIAKASAVISSFDMMERVRGAESPN